MNSMMAARDSGKGGIKAFLSLAFLAGVIFCAAEITPVYFENYELENYMNSVADQAAVHSPRITASTVQEEIFVKAESLGLPIERKDINVSIGRGVHINLDYWVYVDLKLYTVPLHFTPSAENT